MYVNDKRQEMLIYGILLEIPYGGTFFSKKVPPYLFQKALYD